MGCFDIYCLVCGNPCHGMLDFTEYTEQIISRNAYLKKPDLIKDLNKFKKNTLWMNKCTMLLTNNKAIHNCKEIACNYIFADKNRKKHYTHLMEDYNTIRSLFYEGRETGVFIHTDCYKYIKLKYNIKLTYSNLPLLDNGKPNYYKPFKYINYGEIENYWHQDFQFENIYIDNKQYLCSSPLKNDKNISKINKNINAMKISNKYILRPSPPISAVFYKNNDIKVGNNGKLWIIRNGKWNEINKDILTAEAVRQHQREDARIIAPGGADDILKNINITIDFTKMNSKQKTFLHKLSFISQYNTHGVFVKNVTFKKKNIFILDIITTVDNKII